MSLNYIKINGVSSTTIPGLMINSLPPVTLPPKHVEKIEIDGRDGDIIVDKGYSSYDKTVMMSLLRDNAAENLIEFINQSGKIVFSNEPDFYYEMSMIDTVAIERLLRYKQAAVKFHCQPFKYLEFEEVATEIWDGTNYLTNIVVGNCGNVSALPIIKLTTDLDNTTIDNMQISINGEFCGKILGSIFHGVKIDSKNMDCKSTEYTNTFYAYSGDFPKLNPGSNTISWNHNKVKSVEVKNFSRWY